MRDNYLFKILKLAEVQQLNRFKLAEVKEDVQIRGWQQFDVEKNGKKCDNYHNDHVELDRQSERLKTNGNIELLLFTEDEEDDELGNDDIANEVEEEGLKSYKAVNIECKSNKRCSSEFLSINNNRNYKEDENKHNRNITNNNFITMLDPLSEDIQEEP